MSIGKSSIARAVSSTNTVKTHNTTNTNIITGFSVDNIGALSVADTPQDIEAIKKSIAKHGVLCPVLVAVTAKGDTWLIDGYSRFAAAKELGITQINAVVINVETKREANNLYIEFNKIKSTQKSNDIHEEKFHILHVKDHDLPAYLL